MTGKRRTLFAAGGAVALIAAAAAGVAVVDQPFGGSDGTGGSVARAASTAATATIASGRLTSQVYENGTLGYAAQADGAPYAVVNQEQGAFTSLPVTPYTADCGEELYRVDDEPVYLLCGTTPAWRSLYEGMEGPDVQQLNRNLVELGYATEDELDPESDYFGDATATALGELQEDRGLDWTGTLELGEAVFLPGPLRVTRVSATLGTAARPGQPIAQATSTRRRVDVDLQAAQASEVKVGDRAQITLPDNRTTTGVVSRVGTVASAGEGRTGSDASGATIPVAIRLDHPRRVGRLDQAPVGVQITTGRVRDALSVPVTALVAQAGGGYAVETAGAGGRQQLVPVRLGMFDPAGGQVQIEGAGLAAGQRVVVPSS